MKRSFQNDLKFGLSKEEPVRQLLKTKFTEEEDIINTKDLYNDEFCKFDYEGITTKRRYEVKSRTNKKYQFPTTILPVHKITTETTKNGLYIIFNFTDKCSYIIYDKNVFDNFETKIFKIYRDGKYDPPTLHFLIPVNILIDMN
jgi:hypothetical protein